MKTTTLLTTAVATAMLCACSANEELERRTDWQPEQVVAVSFDTYVNRNTTRATFGSIGSEQDLQASSDGFGVFAYMTDDAAYDDATSVPNFFHNQPVRWDVDEARWAYSPVKYWPNEFGSEASVEETDRLSFFAYAPYMPYLAGSTTGQVTTDGLTASTDGITTVTPETSGTAGAPAVVYVTSDDPSRQVDLLWGVVPQGVTSADEVQPQATVGEGLPWLNVTKQKVGGKIKFDFRHALAWVRLGTVQALVDETEENATGWELANKTRIYLRRVELLSDALYGDGKLSLNNGAAAQPAWGAQNAKAGGRFVFDDGWDDDVLAQTDDQDNILAQPSEYPSLSPALIQRGKDGGVEGYGQGVTEVKQDLMRQGCTGFFLLPTDLTTNKLTIRVVYDVETEDPALIGYYLTNGRYGSKAHNVIRKTIDGWTSLVAGRTYTINLQIGMTSVKFDVAEVQGWTDEDPATVNLPVNVISEWGTAAKWSLTRRR